MPNSYIGKMATILWLQPLWAHRDKIPQYCNSTWKPMSESSSAIKRYGNRYSDKLYPNTCCLFFLDAYCVGKHQILRKSSNFHKIPLVNHWIFRKISYLCPRIEAFFAYCKIQKRAEVRSFPYCYLYNIGKRPTSWFSIKVQFRASYRFYLHMGYKVIGRDEFDSFGKSFPIIHLQQPSLPDSKLWIYALQYRIWWMVWG